VLFGVEPATPNEDYGWITPGLGSSGRAVRPVMSFVEKPARATARKLMASGALWNTMVVVARAGTLFQLYREHLPGLATVFLEALQLPARERDAFLSLQYPRLPSLDFSQHLLTQARGLETCAWPGAMGWSDLGTPERLRRWLATGARARRPAERTAHVTTAA
jgi:mannose-1-phosphate guanylyltransferase/mannose-6-phosphate isomerase